MSSAKRLPSEQRKSLNSSQDSLYIPHFTQGSIGDKPNNKELNQSLHKQQSPTQSQPQSQPQQHQLPQRNLRLSSSLLANPARPS